MATVPLLCSLFWLFMFCGLLGVGIEYAIILFSHGPIESRAGVLYGPFNQIYGSGAVLLVLLLRRVRHVTTLFFGSFLIGGLFEIVSSWLQETVFGSISWDYSQAPYNFFGRTSLSFMVLWGVLGVLLLKLIYPGISLMLKKLPGRALRQLTWLAAAVMALNLMLSAAAVFRAAERYRQIPAVNFIQKSLDQLYPDELIRKIYPNMQQLR